MSHLSDLPDELLSHVAQYLDYRELVTLFETSRRLREISSQPRLWYQLLTTSLPFDARRNYIEEFAWRRGRLTVDVQSDLAPKDEKLFEALTFFPLHRAYGSRALAELAPDHIPWATEQLYSRNDDLLILACRSSDMIAHIYHESSSDRHRLLVLREYQDPLLITDLPDWPLCASFIGDNHIVVCGRFPALLLFDLTDKSLAPTAIPLSSHVISCMAFDSVGDCGRILVCGHYKGRGSMELLNYAIDAAGKLRVYMLERNRFAGVTTIVSCTFLPGGSIMTYDNYCHIYLWSSITNAIRKIDHDGIGDAIPSDIVYKMFYGERQLIFVDQYKRQHAFVIRLGGKSEESIKSEQPTGKDSMIPSRCRGIEEIWRGRR